MTLKQLEYFLSCATLLNFRKAAQLHYISPPTLTRSISSLEEELGIQLFQRDSRNMVLTEMGSVFFDSAFHMLVTYQNFYDRTNLAGMRLRRQGNPFLVGSYAFDGMYGALVDLLLAQPDYFLNRPIHIDFSDSGDMIDSVLNGDVYIGIDSHEHVMRSGHNFETRLLAKVPFQAAVPDTSPLAGIKSICLEALLKHFRDQTPHPKGGAFFREKLCSSIVSAEQLRQLGECTIDALPELMDIMNQESLPSSTILILPRLLTAGGTGQLHRIDIEGDPCSTDYVLFWCKDNRDPDILKFINTVFS